MKAAIFAHYDPGERVDPHVIYYLRALRDTVDQLLLVSTARLSPEMVTELEAMGLEVYLRDNRGLDFSSYAAGLERLELSRLDGLLLCNDSVYGPLTPLRAVLEQFSTLSSDFGCITSSHEIATHAQSYFLWFGRSVLESDAFRDFWRGVEPLASKRDVIRRYEVGLSQRLIKAGFPLTVYARHEAGGQTADLSTLATQALRTFARRWRSTDFWRDVRDVLLLRSRPSVNPTQVQWRDLLATDRCPFIKVELLRDDPKGGLVRDELLRILRARTDYPVALIESHLARFSTEGRASG